MTGILQTITYKTKQFFVNLSWAYALHLINKAMSKQKDKDKNKTTEAAEVKKPTLSVEEVKKFQGELNKIELEIIRNITDPFKVVQLRKQKDELLIKNGIDPNAPWKKPNT